MKSPAAQNHAFEGPAGANAAVDTDFAGQWHRGGDGARRRSRCPAAAGRGRRVRARAGRGPGVRPDTGYPRGRAGPDRAARGAAALGPAPAELRRGGRAYRRPVPDAGRYRVGGGTARHRAGHAAAGARASPCSSRWSDAAGSCPSAWPSSGWPTRACCAGGPRTTVLRADVATARAVAPLDRLAELAIRRGAAGRDGARDQGANGRGRTEEGPPGPPANWCPRRRGCAGGAR